MKKIMLLAFLHVIFVVSYCQVWTQQQRIFADDAGSRDYFGYNVAIDGNIAVVTAEQNDDYGSNSGSIYVFEKIDGSWEQQVKILPSDSGSNQYFGSSVAIDGNYIVVGSSGSYNTNIVGKAYVYKRIDNSWVEQAILTPQNGEIDAYFGEDVSIDNGIIAIGCPGDLYTFPPTQEGAVHIYKLIEDQWVEHSILQASDGEVGNAFGRSVCVNNGRLLIACPRDDNENGEDKGSVYYYTYESDVWTETDKIIHENMGINQFGFGTAISLNGNYFITSTYTQYGINTPSYAYIYELISGDWERVRTLGPSLITQDAHFGHSVAINNSYAIVGAPAHSGPGDNNGRCFFSTNNNGNWTSASAIISPYTGADNYFGCDVDIDGECLIIGASWEDGVGIDSGAAFIYANSETSNDNNSLAVTPSNLTCYPNPFNPTTKISYNISKYSHTTLEVFNIKGQLIKTLVNEKKHPGIQSVCWSGDDNMGNKVSSGIYFYRLTNCESSEIKKMVLMK